MKHFNKASLYTICSLALALSSLIRFKGVSFLLFGEPEFPTEK